MSMKMTSLYVKSRAYLEHRMQDDRGQGVLEYVGILVVVGALAAAAIALLGPAASTVTTKVTAAIKDFLG